MRSAGQERKAVKAQRVGTAVGKSLDSRYYPASLGCSIDVLPWTLLQFEHLIHFQKPTPTFPLHRLSLLLSLATAFITDIRLPDQPSAAPGLRLPRYLSLDSSPTSHSFPFGTSLQHSHFSGSVEIPTTTIACLSSS